MRVELTLINDKKIFLLPFDIEFFYDDKGIVVVKTRDGNSYKVKETIGDINQKIIVSKTRKLFDEKETKGN